MTKRKIIIFITVVFVCSVVFGSYQLYQYLRIKNAKIEVVLKEDLTIEFGQQKKISDFVVQFNGDKILDDEVISYTEIGKKEVTFSFVNTDHIKVKYTFIIEIIDTEEPLIWLGNSYRVKKDSNIKLEEVILCGDNYDSNPTCLVEGEYDLSTVGNYSLTFKAKDSSGNEYHHPFTLNVYEPVISDTQVKEEDNRIDFNDIIAKYKTENTKIGIDVSSWQGDIDFEKVKKAGVEFIFLRVGSKKADYIYFIDKKFKRNIQMAEKYHIPVGVYFYSYAMSIEEARKDAKWVLKQIKNYDITLPVAFDWEEWGNFNQYHLSFFGLTSMAEAFLEEIEQAGYEGMLYSSKTYLENIWFPTKYDIWLAHYTDSTTYEGKYRYWQMTSNAKIDGIIGPVDVNIFGFQK